MPKTLLITGSSRGLGRALAEAALAAGHRVLATARTPDALRDLTERYPGTARAAALDVTDPDAAEAAVKTAVRAFGRLDAVLNNAGYSQVGAIEDTSLEDFRAQLETNLWGAVHVSKAALPVLRAQRGGHLVQISSLSGRLAPVAGLGAYVTAKFALEGFSEALALEAGGFGVKVTIVEPGSIATTLSSGMVRTPPSAPYTEVVAPLMNRYADPAAGHGTSPRRAAEVLLKLLDLPEPPLWLPLGGDALDHVRAAERRKLAELDRWAGLSREPDEKAAGEVAR
ncbi:short-chain dehydrogenase/reductase [Streptomyces sulfonofaciens]|uniref:Short-chain dehydrogenase/reductase n=1 Tax=Streptomyces sulfonofaciens TaxID=68272 RepID=A0A919GD77_9ACTN|nr:SDR family NAD(P)-dependent oxidoreductase [Streptomyces sulfonofaciens]GHH81856.1 short-chain dehydrogenase/reductase [Streptomyces sulfonofaciens]